MENSQVSQKLQSPDFAYPLIFVPGFQGKKVSGIAISSSSRLLVFEGRVRGCLNFGSGFLFCSCRSEEISSRNKNYNFGCNLPRKPEVGAHHVLCKTSSENVRFYRKNDGAAGPYRNTSARRRPQDEEICPNSPREKSAGFVQSDCKTTPAGRITPSRRRNGCAAHCRSAHRRERLKSAPAQFFPQLIYDD
jgi:hypothetical protein